jgi:hypothetical protein
MACASTASTSSRVFVMSNIFVSPLNILPCSCYNSKASLVSPPSPTKHGSVMDRLQTSGELQDKTSFIDPSTGVDLLKGCSPDYLLL